MSPLTREDDSDYFCSPERLQGEFIIRAYRFTPPTGSLESPQRLLLLFTAFVDFGHFRKSSQVKSSCFILQPFCFFQANRIGVTHHPKKKSCLAPANILSLSGYIPTGDISGL
jgi:hypothetical protein